MPRRNRAEVRDVLPDPKFNSKVVAKFINQVMVDGKKSIAQTVVYNAFDIVSEKTGKDPLEVFTQAVANVTPELECKARRVGGATYQVPSEIRPARRQTLAIRWLVSAARNRKKTADKTMDKAIANELMDALNNTGGAVKKKEEMHRMAEANKAFAHYRY